MDATIDRVLEAAEGAVTAFVTDRPEYAIGADQPVSRGGTNRVTLGVRAGEPIVLKYFPPAWRWQNERFCLRHFATTGCVPRLLDEAPPHLLVIARLPGRDLDVTDLVPARVAALSQAVGRALGRLVDTPLPAPGPPAPGAPAWDARPRDFDALPWDQHRRDMLEGYLERCRPFQRDIPAYAGPLLARSLDLLEAQLEGFERQRHVLFHQDIANLRADRERFVGFYDLEMCRLGTEAMPLGAALGLCGPAGLEWPALLDGYEAQTAPGRGAPLPDALAVLAMHHLYHWQRICRWGAWEGDPNAVALRRASEADAGVHRRAMDAACRALWHSAPVAAWFGAT